MSGCSFLVRLGRLLGSVATIGLAACGHSAQPHSDVAGDVVLSSGYAFVEGNGDLIRPSQLAVDVDPLKFGCTGIDRFGDVGVGSVVSLLDGASAIIATGKIDQATPEPDDSHRYVRCAFHFTIQSAPSGVTGAQLRVGQHPAVALTADYGTGFSAVDLTQ